MHDRRSSGKERQLRLEKSSAIQFRNYAVKRPIEWNAIRPLVPAYYEPNRSDCDYSVSPVKSPTDAHRNRASFFIGSC